MLSYKRLFSLRMLTWLVVGVVVLLNLSAYQGRWLALGISLLLILVNLLMNLSFTVKPPATAVGIEGALIAETLSISALVILASNPIFFGFLFLLPITSRMLLLRDLGGTFLHSIVGSVVYALSVIFKGKVAVSAMKELVLPILVMNSMPFIGSLLTSILRDELKDELAAVFRRRLEEAQRISRERTKELERATEELRALLEQQEAMLSLIQTLASHQSDLQKVLRHIVVEAKEVAQVQVASILLENSGLLRPEFSIDLPEVIKMRLTVDLSKPGNETNPLVRAFKEKKIIIANYDDAPDFFRTLETINFRVKDIAIFPLIGGSKQCVGLLLLLNSYFGYDEKKINFLRTLGIQAGIVLENSMLHKKLKDGFYESIIAFSSAIEAKDKYTHVMHTKRVADLAKEIALEMGFSEEDAERIWIGGLLHDVGKLAIPDSILSKQGPLTEEEREIIKKHPEEGAKMLSRITFFRERNIIPIILYHHERYDGKGYPKGLKGKQIPLEANIVAIADTYDAIATPRPYNRHYASHERAIEIIKKERGKQFYPEVVDAFMKVIARRKGTRKIA